MSKLREFGVAVIGLGIAGKVRVRDLKTERTCLRLKAVVSRRPSEIEDVQVMSAEEVFKSPDIDAVFICTEPGLHEEYSRQALQNGKHVLVEYPISLSSKAACELFDLAEKNGLVLYEENIALLTEGFLTLKEKAETTELVSGSYSLKGSYNGWLEKFDQSGLPFVSGVSGIQMMLAAFGDVTVKNGSLEENDSGYTATATLATESGKSIDMTLSRSKSKDVRREKSWVFDFEDGEIIDSNQIQQKSSKPGLFMQDMEHFCEALEVRKISNEHRQLRIRSLQVAETIHTHFKNYS